MFFETLWNWVQKIQKALYSLLLILIFFLAHSLSFADSNQEISMRPLKARVAPIKPIRTVIEEGVYPERIVVKFREGSQIRLRKAGLVSFARENFQNDLSQVQRVLAQYSGLKVSRLFSRPEKDLDQERSKGQSLSGQQLADLNLYYLISLAGQDVMVSNRLVDALNALDIVEIAYFLPVSELAVVRSRPSRLPISTPIQAFAITPDFSIYQGYLNSAPNGIDAKYAWQIPGGKGARVKVIDIEEGWQDTHEDLSKARGGLINGPSTGEEIDHGTAVLGEIIGDDNGLGVTGIASDADIAMVQILMNDYPVISDAINIAASHLNKGDIFLIEVHAPGPFIPPDCNNSYPENQCGYIPMEYWQDNFDAIQTATVLGKICVEAGGNGSVNLDHSAYGRKFDRKVRDSGAILVSGGVPNKRNAEWFTNYGGRLDVQGWGSEIVTAGYGDLFRGGGNPDRYYTEDFGGTSGASPIVVGAAASLQGIYKAKTGKTVSPQRMRQILISTGTPQTGSRKIGPLPNLKKAIALLLTDYEEIIVGFGRYPADGGKLRVLGNEDNNYAHVAWLKAGWKTYNQKNGETRVAMGDVDGDGLDEIVVGYGRSGGNGYFKILDDADHGYAVLATRQVSNASYNKKNGEVWPAAGDIDGDGRAEIVVGLGSTGHLELFDDALGKYKFLRKIKAGFSKFYGINAGVRPACGDVDGDGKDEIVVSFGKFPENGSLIRVLDDGRHAYKTLKWIGISPVEQTANGVIYPACGDVDGDDRAEIVIGFGPHPKGGYIEVLDDHVAHYKSLIQLEVGQSQKSEATRPACGDLDGDGKDEIVVGFGPHQSGGGYIQVLDDASKNYARIKRIRVGTTKYNAANGETRLAIGNVKSKK